MLPTLHINQRVLANRMINKPSIGDIVVFHPPAGAEQGDGICQNNNEGFGHAQACDLPTPQQSSATFIKRVVAGPGDRISIVNGHVIRNGVQENDSYILPCSGGSASCNFPTDDHRSARRLLHDGGQPWRVRRLTILGPCPRQMDHRRRVLHILAAGPDRVPLGAR